MRPRLMFADADFVPVVHEGPAARDLIDDLQLEELWAGMARGDGRLGFLARAAMLGPLTAPQAIAYRQEVLADCLRNVPAVRALYDLVDRAVTEEQQIVRGLGTSSEVLLNRSRRSLDLFCGRLRRLRAFAAENARAFDSSGFTRMFQMISERLDERYLDEIEALLGRIDFEHGVIADAGLGEGNRSTGIRLQEPAVKGRGSAAQRRLRRSRRTYTIDGGHDDNWRALTAFRSRVLEAVATAAAESADQVRDFFVALRDELGFYVGCVNVAETLEGYGLPLCRPEPRPVAERAFAAEELREPCLALRRGGPVVGNDLAADEVGLIVVTGANRGGKSTFLRSVGVAHLMMQSGMLVPARRFAASPAGGVFTHFKREEDQAMRSGRLDEELTRMSTIVDALRADSLLLCNESFMSTNEREGSDISVEIVRALTDVGVRVVFVTHLHDFARRMHADRSDRCVFLNATRGADGERSFRLAPGVPSATAHAADLYARIFGAPLG